jgi:NitT/TauT family transport system substrate-binding protein
LLRSVRWAGVSPPRRRRSAVAVVVSAVVLVSGCGLFSGSAAEPDAATGGVVEKTNVKVAVIPSTDMAPLWVARDKGYFSQEGLSVELVTMGGGGDVMAALIGGDVDMAFVSYPLMVQAQLKGKGKVNLKVVADASAAKPATTAVMVAKDSPLRSAVDLEGKRIAVTSTGSMADLAVMVGMKSAKADISKIDWKLMKFPDMLPKLASREIDAAFLTEPFVTIAQSQLGAWTVFQPMVGQLDGFALTGYVALERTTTDHPKTVAAFQRAVRKVHREAGTPAGESAIRDVLVREAKVDPKIAPVLHLPAYPITTDPTRLQRVPDLLQEFNLLTEKFDIAPMILPG